MRNCALDYARLRIHSFPMQELQRPEGALIAAGLKKSKLSARRAAERAGLSDARWRQIVNGYQSVGVGQRVPVVGPAETIARMAKVAGVTADQLREAGRPDAADEMKDPWQHSEDEPGLIDQTLEMLSGDLHPQLGEFTDHELVAEVNARMLLLAARLRDLGEADALIVVRDPVSGETVLTSRPKR